MNYVTEQIMELLDVPVEMALAVQDVMDESDLDFSECTDFQFRKCVRESYSIYLNQEERY